MTKAAEMAKVFMMNILDNLEGFRKDSSMEAFMWMVD